MAGSSALAAHGMRVTGHRAPIVGVETDPRLLVDIANDWNVWLVGMDGGHVCSRPGLRRADR